MSRRALLLSAFLLVAAAPVAADDPRAAFLPDAFAALGDEDRRTAQEELRTGGFYEGPRDGVYDPEVAAGLLEAADYLAENWEGHEIPLASPPEAAAYLRDLAGRRLSAWLYGEGECEGGDC